MILNPNKTKALVICRSRAVNSPHGDLVLFGVSIGTSPNRDILSVKFDSKPTFKNHVRGIIFRVSHRIGILRLVKRIFVDTSVLLRCYFAFVIPILEYCYPVWGSASECHLQLLECVFICHALLWSEFLNVVSSTSCCRLNMLYKVTANSNHCLFSELPSASTRVRHTRAAVAVHPLEFEVSRCRTSQFARRFLQAQVRTWNDLPYTAFDTGTLDGFKGAVNRWLLPKVVFTSVFRGAGVSGVAKVIYKQLCFCLLGLRCCF